MKSTYSFLILLSFILNANAQVQFEKLNDHPLVNAPSDARSVNFVDVNGDGLDDVFITSGPQAGATHLLYINNGNMEFEEIGPDPISTTSGPFDGASFADADNDGDLDAMAVTWHGVRNFLYFGNGDGTFEESTNSAPTQGLTYSETTAWGDYDNDGLVDLYVTNSNGNDPNFLFRNLGNGNFEKVSSGAAVTDERVSRSVNWVDFDNDCDLDLFVTNESNQADDLYRNLGDGTFEKVASNEAPSQSNRSTMSSSWGDIDNDGDLDLFVANSAFFATQNNQLFSNNGDGTFTEITTGDAVTDGGCSYGSSFGDYDNDGDLDLMVVNGFCSGAILNYLYENDGTGTFTRNEESIEDLSTPCSFGTAWGDLDDDGFLDLGIATCKNTTGSPSPENIFYRNLGNGNNYLKIKPIGTLANYSAIGAKVWVTATINGNEVTQYREISSQTGYCGQNSLWAHFGMGDATEASEVRIQFSCDSDTTLTNIPINQMVEVKEDMTTSTGEILRGDVQRLNISPNPSSGQLWADFFLEKNTQDINVEIFNSMGQLITSNHFSTKGIGQQNISIDLEALGLENGIYVLKIGDEQVKFLLQ